MSYWKNDDKIQMRQTQVSIPSKNGLNYSGVAGQSGKRVDFEIPSTVKFMDGKNSYLNFNVKLSPDVAVGTTRLSLDPNLGGQSLIRNIRIYSGNRAVLLETAEDYDAEVSLIYSYDQDESIRKMRALKEGSLVETPLSRGTLGTSTSNNIDISTNPYFKQEMPGAGDYGADDFLTAKVSLPLHMGIFAKSKKIWPNMLTDGLYVEIDLQDCARCVCQLDSVNRWRRMKQNPLVRGSAADATNFAIGNDEFTEIYLSLDNNITSISNCPFVVGEKIGICKVGDPTSQASLTISDGAGGDVQGFPTIQSIDVGDDGGITYIKLVTDAFKNSATGTGYIIVTDECIVYSAALDRERVEVDDRTANLIPAITQYAASYTLSDMELVVQQVEVDPRYESGMISKMKEGGVIEMDIMTCTNYKHSVLKSNRNATLNLGVSNTRAKSIFAVGTDATPYSVPERMAGLGKTYSEEFLTMDGRLDSIRSGKVGCIDNLTSYQWLIDDKLTPSRPVVVSKINGARSIAAQPLIELEKSLNQAAIVPRSFCDFNRNFMISRAYALNDGVMDLNNKSNQLQLLYNERNAGGVDLPPTRDKLFLCFVYGLTRISIRGDSVSVSV